MAQVQGFTLVELLVTLSVVAVLATIAAPGMQSLVETSRLKTATNEVLAGLAQTRSLAIKEGGRVSMCKSSTGSQCTTSGNWEQGWIIFADPTRNSPWTNANVDSGESVQLYTQAITGNIVIKGNANVSQYASYSADGMSRQLNGAFLAGTIRVCSTSSALSDSLRAKDIVINSVGRVITVNTSVSNACAAPS